MLTPGNRGGKSQPANLGRVPPNQQTFGSKFVDPADPRQRHPPISSPRLNTQSDYLVDIDIKPTKIPAAKDIHEPPFDGGDKTPSKLDEKSQSPPRK